MSVCVSGRIQSRDSLVACDGRADCFNWVQQLERRLSEWIHGATEKRVYSAISFSTQFGWSVFSSVSSGLSVNVLHIHLFQLCADVFSFKMIQSWFGIFNMDRSLNSLTWDRWNGTSELLGLLASHHRETFTQMFAQKVQNFSLFFLKNEWRNTNPTGSKVLISMNVKLQTTFTFSLVALVTVRHYTGRAATKSATGKHLLRCGQENKNYHHTPAASHPPGETWGSWCQQVIVCSTQPALTRQLCSTGEQLC